VRIVSWNVNGLRSIGGKGFLDWVGTASADVIAVQETRARHDQIPEPLRTPPGYHTHFVHAERGGYSGVGMYSKHALDRTVTSLGVKTFDVEGRVQMATIGALTIANVYFPNGNGLDRDNSRVPYKLRFTRKVFQALEAEHGTHGRVVVLGDFNIAPNEIDLARPKENKKTSGFLPEERKVFGGLLARGWVDSFRHFEKGEGHYSWWSQRFGVRAKNIGWRIDLALVSPGAMPFLKAAAIHPDVKGSDHCPISVDLHDEVLKR
jgi:exodeoxyribonuclease III